MCAGCYSLASAYSGHRGTIWIDDEDRLVVRWQAAVARGPKAGTMFFETESERMPDGIWTGIEARVNLAADEKLFGNHRKEWIYHLQNRRRFDVSVDQTI